MSKDVTALKGMTVIDTTEYKALVSSQPIVIIGDKVLLDKDVFQKLVEDNSKFNTILNSVRNLLNNSSIFNIGFCIKSVLDIINQK